MAIEGKVSSKLHVTIPARVRDALGIQPGDTIRYELAAGSVRLRVVGPDIGEVLESVWARHHGRPLLTRDARARPTYDAIGVSLATTSEG